MKTHTAINRKNKLLKIIFFTSAILVILVAWNQLFVQEYNLTSTIHPDDYVIFAGNSIHLGQKVEILSGSVGVNNLSSGPVLDSEVELSVDQKVTSLSVYALKANRIRIRQNANIGSNVFYNEIENKGIIMGNEVSPLKLPLFSKIPPLKTAPAGIKNITVSTKDYIVLAAGDFGDIVIKNRSVLLFTGGIYNIRNIDSDANAKILFSNPSEIRISNRFNSNNDVYIGPENQDSEIDASDIVFHVAGINGDSGTLEATPKSVQLGTNNTIFACFYAPNGTLWIQQHTNATGAFWAKDVLVGQDVQLSFDCGIGVLDDTLPVLTVNSPPDGIITSETSIYISGIATDNRSAEVTINEISVDTDSSGLFETDVTLNEGTNTIIVTATDPADNKTTVQRTVICDTESPVLTVSEPADGISTSDDVIAVTGTVFDSTNITLAINYVLADIGADGVFCDSVSLSEGENVITIVAVDEAGNSTTVTRTVIYETVKIPPDPATVAPELDPTVVTTMAASTEFLYTGTNPIQTGVDSVIIKPERAAVLRGKVLTSDGEPLPEVKITINNHPEYGQTFSRTDGWFDMAVNGGGYLTVDYVREGYLPAQRQINIPWQDYVVLDSVIMVQLDPKVAVINFSDTIQVARGSVVTDEDGQRQATLLFKQETQAQMILSDGTVQALDSLSVRVTEYTIGSTGPAAMPAKLPSNVAYTYCAEISCDQAIQAGATEVLLSQPVAFYVENFIGFPVGTPVPFGYYDRVQDSWIPSDNGMVTGIVNIANGLAELDMNGDGIAEHPDSIAASGITAAELKKLASMYAPGQSLWRVEIKHFTPIDLNWPFELPEDAIEPDQPEPTNEEIDDECTVEGSIIGVQNQTLGQAVPLTGTGMNLHYQSNRVPGRVPVLDIPLTGPKIPSSLKRIELIISVAGREFKHRFFPESNLSYRFIWDRRDSYGRYVNGLQSVQIKIGYVYKAFYQIPPDLVRSFAQFGNSDTFVPTRQEITLWQNTVSRIGVIPQPVANWRPGILHTYDPISKVLYSGDGSRRNAENVGLTINTIVKGQPYSYSYYITTGQDGSLYFTDYSSQIHHIYRMNEDSTITLVAGSAKKVFGGDDGPAVNAQINYPYGIAFGPDSSYYIADRNNNRIRKVNTDGIITTIAGTGKAGYSGDSGPAYEAKLYQPQDVAVGQDGSVYIADYRNHRIRKIDPGGIITTVAGTGQYGYSGDGGPAINAKINRPASIVFGPDGSLYFSDQNNRRIRKVNPEGIITKVAGTGSYGSSGDGGPAVNARFRCPDGLAFGPDSSLYIADLYSNCIRKIGQDGIICTVAGTGQYGYSGDGGPAVNAKLRYPRGVFVSSNGCLYIADSNNHRIRKVSTDGIISTVAGKGSYGYSGDGGPATDARLCTPHDVTFGPDSSLYITDSLNDRVRKVEPGGIIYTSAGTGDYFGVGDGGPAVDAQINRPTGMDFGKDGSLYFADQDHFRVRKIGPDGVITTVAGTGKSGFSGNGGPATEAKLLYIQSIAAAPDGSFYILEYNYFNSYIRKVTPDGIINKVTGGPWGFSGDGGPAIDARIDWAYDIAVGPDGSLYIADSGNSRIRKIGPDGIITTVAGTGYRIYNGDGIPAVEANINWPISIDVDSDGILYIADTQNCRIRKLGQDGIITTVAGNGEWEGPNGDGGFPGDARLWPQGVAVSPDHSIYLMDRTKCVRKVSIVFPEFSKDDIQIPSEHGSELFVFSSQGKHLKTLDALNHVVKYEFVYGENGLLTGIKDIDGLITTIQRDEARNPVAVVSPFNQHTILTVDSCGYLTSITNPAGETESFIYNDNGLMISRTDARGNVYQYTYDELGRLILDQDPVGGFTALSNTDLPNGWEVTQTSAEGRSRTYRVERLADGSTRMTNTNESGLATVSVTGTNGKTRITYPDGTTTTSKLGPDPRFGLVAPIVKNLTVSTHTGLNLKFSQSRSISIMAGNTVLGLRDTITVLGRKTVSEYDGTQNLFKTTSPEGRQSFTYTDSLGCVVQDSIPGIRAVNYFYNDKGFLVETEQDVRKTGFTYNDQGWLETVTDPLNRTTQMVYDSVGRVTKQVLADNREILYNYDANGNLTSLMPPGRPAHNFSHTLVDLTEDYNPPELTDSSGITKYFYNLDRQIVCTIMSDSSMIQVFYDTTGCGCGGVGKPAKIIFDRGETIFNYNASTGQLSEIISPIFETLNFEYDGSLPLSVEWAGTVRGSVGVTYNNDFRINSQSVNSKSTVLFGYDNDGLLTQAGDMMIYHNYLNGMITSTILGNLSTNYTYNEFGEIVKCITKCSGSELFSTSYQLDSIGRIEKLTETVLGKTREFSYYYDTAGRLVQVDRNDTTVSVYEYDDNGNRLSYTGLNGTIYGTYDDQDRMLTYGNADYSYTANGSLKYKAENGDTTWYHYDLLGNLMSVSLPNGDVIEYLIDGQNRRIGKKVNGVLKRQWLYQDQLNPVAELDGSGNLISRFVYGSKIHIPDYMISDGVKYRIISDHLGSVRLVLNAATGNVVQQIDYDEFGNVVFDSNSGFQPFGYAGGLYDINTGLVRFGARDYDALVGRWSAKDPILFGGNSFNFYSYVRNNPINSIDPSGLWVGIDDLIFSVGGGIAGLISQGISDMIAGEWSSWQNYAGSFVGGLAYGEAILYTGPVLAGAIGGAVTDLSKVGFKKLSGDPCANINIGSLLKDTALGALTGMIPGAKIPGITKGIGSFSAISKQMITKLQSKIIKNVSAKTALKMFISRIVDTSTIPGIVGIGITDGFVRRF